MSIDFHYRKLFSPLAPVNQANANIPDFFGKFSKNKQQ